MKRPGSVSDLEAMSHGLGERVEDVAYGQSAEPGRGRGLGLSAHTLLVCSMRRGHAVQRRIACLTAYAIGTCDDHGVNILFVNRFIWGLPGRFARRASVAR